MGELPPYFVITDRVIRDEGTTYHYAKPSEFADADPQIVTNAADALMCAGLHAIIGSARTTDAPFREITEAVEAAG